jgi:predicted transcriptional regulator
MDGEEGKKMIENNWTFLTNYGHVLLCIASDPEVRMREVAEKVGITERAVQRIVADLVQEGYLTREKSGRRNRYKVVADKPLRHPVEWHCSVRRLMEMILEPEQLEKVVEEPED